MKSLRVHVSSLMGWPAFRKAIGVIAVVLCLAPATSAVAASDCAYRPIDPVEFGNQPLEAPEPIDSKDGVLEATLVVDYADQSIAGCDVHLRSYNGGLVGPTLRVKPGDILRIRLDNRLPPNPPVGMQGHNTPHDFNTTNLHTHGLWVSPLGNGDNVTLRIQPGTSFDYEIAIPQGHPPGTFWYHAHVHGSTALQVSSGMAGTIVIEGGLDTVPEIAAATNQVLLFQQIAYNEEGEIENYDALEDWGKTQRRTTINGQIAPRIHMHPGEVQRWRMVHGGVGETLLPSIVKLPPGMEIAAAAQLDSAALTALDRAVSLHEIAVDGLALGRIDTWEQVELQPGYRSDVLVKAPDEGGLYALVDRASTEAEGLLGVSEEGRILAFVRIDGAPMDMPLPDDAAVAGFLPHQPISDDDLTGRPQEVRMEIAARRCNAAGVCREECELDEPGCAYRYMINDSPYSDSHNRAVQLETAAEWTLSSIGGGHPFHIHVNPFEVKRAGPDGRPQTVWRDTLFVRAGNTVKVRTRYERFIGTFVLHCHILNHEDRGMMELVTIVAPPKKVLE